VKRSGPLRKAGRLPTREQLEVEIARQEFADVVLHSYGCRACGSREGRFHAHHVIYRQHIDEAVRWDARNAMAVCADCHERHHNASRRIPLSRLSSTHLEFAREVLGDYADDYLARYYGDA
jgi:hypothetical protein